MYVGHGSRIAKGNEQVKQFIEKVRERVDIPIQELAFLEKAQPTVLEGIQRCIAQGATSINVIPIFLFAANHVKVDLPDEIAKGKQLFPDVTFSIGKEIGPDYAVIEMLVDRLQEKGFSYNLKENKDVAVLLVGRGSSDEKARADFAKMVRFFSQTIPVKKVSYCFLAANTPLFKEELEKMVKENYSMVYVVPYLLFTGVLMKRMGHTIREYQKIMKKNIVLTNYLGYHPKLVDLIVDRTKLSIKREEIYERVPNYS